MSDQETVAEEEVVAVVVETEEPTVEEPATAEDSTPAEAETPVAEAEAPVAEAEIPVAEAEAPVAEAETPVAEAEAPVAEAEAPVAEAEAPVAEAETPVAEAETPVAEAEAPVAEAEAASSEAETTAEDDSDSNIHSLEPRQHLTGKVKNITPFGAFVDVGLAQDGLVHISELARQKVEKVEDVVSVGQEVEVWVKKVDTKRGRISLTMIRPIKLRLRDIEEDAELDGTVTRLEAYGAFIDIDSERDGLVHISQITHDYIKHPQDALTTGDTVKVKVLKVNRKKRQVDLSIKALLPPPVVEKPASKPGRVKEEVVAIEEEPIPTAMAIAFASVQEKDDQAQATDNTDDNTSTEKSKLIKEREDIISRTLAAG